MMRSWLSVLYTLNWGLNTSRYLSQRGVGYSNKVRENPCISKDVRTLPSIILRILYLLKDLVMVRVIILISISEHPPRLFRRITILSDFNTLENLFLNSSTISSTPFIPIVYFPFSPWIPNPSQKLFGSMLKPTGFPGREQAPRAMFRVKSLELMELPRVRSSFKLNPSWAALPRIWQIRISPLNPRAFYLLGSQSMKAMSSRTVKLSTWIFFSSAHCLANQKLIISPVQFFMINKTPFCLSTYSMAVSTSSEEGLEKHPPHTAAESPFADKNPASAGSCPDPPPPMR